MNSMSVYLAASSLIVGSICRQGPHHVAVKSTTIYGSHERKIDENQQDKSEVHTIRKHKHTILEVPLEASKCAFQRAEEWNSRIRGVFRLEEPRTLLFLTL